MGHYAMSRKFNIPIYEGYMLKTAPLHICDIIKYHKSLQNTDMWIYQLHLFAVKANSLDFFYLSWSEPESEITNAQIITGLRFLVNP